MRRALKDFEAEGRGQSSKGKRSHINERSRLGGDQREGWGLVAPGGTRPVSRGQHPSAPAC